MVSTIVRFAPSPNGLLHLGHAYSALLNHRYAMKKGGRFLLRIEDIDVGRSRPEFEEGIYEDLDWLGIKWEQPVRRQSDHFEDYQEAVRKLEQAGLLYPCAASRQDILSHLAKIGTDRSLPCDPDGGQIYPGIYRDRTVSAQELQDVRHAKRLNMSKAIERVEMQGGLPLYFWTFRSVVRPVMGNNKLIKHKAFPEAWGDVVLVRKDIPTSYHLSVVVDDALQGVTHIIRGQDLEQATSIHVLLQALLGLKTPLYSHHDLVRTQEGRKLSKSASDTSLRAIRQAGWTADDVKEALFGDA